MRIKNMISAALAALLLIMFLPVFYCTVFIGNNINYNPEHKIQTLLPNTTLLACALLAVLVLTGLFFLLRRVPANKGTVIGTVLFSAVICFLFYLVKVDISKCIAFYGGWDCGMVANSARQLFEGQDIGYDNYYYFFINNVPIVWLLYVLYAFVGSLADYAYNPEFIWIQFQCLMFALAIFFSAMTVLAVSKKIAPTVISLLLGVIFLGLCPWQIIPYTDAGTIAMPGLIVLLYVLFLRIRSKWKYILWLLTAFVGMVAGVMKATCYVAVIAVVLVDFTWLVFGREHVLQKIKKLAFRAVLLFCGFVLASWCRDGMYKTVKYVPNYDMQITWSNVLYDGLNELTTGACSDGGLSIAESHVGYSRSYRRMVELHYVKDRMAEKGFPGLIYFWLRKEVMNFNDGTFSWFQEGFFHAWDYEDITDSRFKEPLRNFYWNDGTSYQVFTTWSQGIWIFVLLGMILESIFVIKDSRFCAALMTRISRKSGQEQGDASAGYESDDEALCVRTVLVVTFIGVFLFVMLFEGRARYLLNNTLIFATMAALGYTELAQIICGSLTKMRLKK